MKLDVLPFIVSSAADADIDWEPARQGRTLISTNNLSANRVVGINGTGIDLGERCRVVRNAAAPGAFTVTIKTGTAAGGATIATLVASKNGFADFEWDGSKWVLVGQSVAS